LVVPADSDAKSARDLQGRTVGLTGINNMVHILLVKWLSDQSIDTSQIHFVEASIAQMPDILRARQLDAVVAIEPFLSRIVSSGTGRVLGYFQDGVPACTATMVWRIGGAYAKAHPETIKAIRTSLADALAYRQAYPSDDNATLARYPRMPPELLTNLPKPNYANDFNPEQIAYWAAIMEKQKLLSRPVDFASIAVPSAPPASGRRCLSLCRVACGQAPSGQEDAGESGNHPSPAGHCHHHFLRTHSRPASAWRQSVKARVSQRVAATDNLCDLTGSTRSGPLARLRGVDAGRGDLVHDQERHGDAPVRPDHLQIAKPRRTAAEDHLCQRTSCRGTSQPSVRIYSFSWWQIVSTTAAS
jgi:hypothetical protein